MLDQRPEPMALAKAPPKALLELSDLEALLLQGDLERLSPEGRVKYYEHRCRELGLDPFSRPFDYMKVPVPGMKGVTRLVLYANKNAAEQLREKHHISSEVTNTVIETGIYRVTVRAKKPIIIDKTIVGWRSYDDLGAVTVAGLGGEQLSNAMMKAHTKAHRRATLGLLGLGMSDETEVTSIRGAQIISHEEVQELGTKFLPSSTKVEEPQAS